MAKPKQPQMSEAEKRARSRGMKGSTELAEQFAISDAPPRELVKVDVLPDPPGTAMEVQSRSPRAEAVNLDEAVMNIFREEAEEIGIRLERFGIPFTPAMKQDLIDHVFSLISLNQQGFATGGGAIARR